MKHIADAEPEFVVTNVPPDFCEVDGCVVAFDICQKMSDERADYSPNFFARGQKVLKVGSIIRGTEGNAGKGVLSGVAEKSGDAMMIEGAAHLFVNGKAICRHLDKALMNGKR